jgi:hypothetical protein
MFGHPSDNRLLRTLLKFRDRTPIALAARQPSSRLLFTRNKVLREKNLLLMEEFGANEFFFRIVMIMLNMYILKYKKL